MMCSNSPKPLAHRWRKTVCSNNKKTVPMGLLLEHATIPPHALAQYWRKMPLARIHPNPLCANGSSSRLTAPLGQSRTLQPRTPQAIEAMQGTADGKIKGPGLWCCMAATSASTVSGGGVAVGVASREASAECPTAWPRSSAFEPISGYQNRSRTSPKAFDINGPRHSDGLTSASRQHDRAGSCLFYRYASPMSGQRRERKRRPPPSILRGGPAPTGGGQNRVDELNLQPPAHTIFASYRPAELDFIAQIFRKTQIGAVLRSENYCRPIFAK
jgi:hypothetical protein